MTQSTPDDSRFRLLVENIGDVLWFKELNPTRFTYISPAFERIWGHSVAELQKQPELWEQCIHPEDRHAVRKALGQWFNGEKADYEARYRVIGRKGEVRWLADRGIILGRKNGKPYQIGGIARDVTEREAAEATRKRLAAVVENSDDAIITLDLEGVIQTWNAGAERIFQYKAKEAVGKSVAFLRPPEAQDDEVVFRRLIQNGRRIEHYETHRRRKDGRVIDISLSISPLIDSTGRITGLSKISRNITEKKQAEQTIRQLNAELEQRVQERTAELREQMSARLRLEEEILHISEREQRRIGQDLHDDLGQQLAGTWMMADVLQRTLEDQNSPYHAEAKKLGTLLQKALAHTRALARGLHPVAPEQGGFARALQTLAKHSGELFGIHCRFEIRNLPTIDDDTTGTHLYRIAQEAVSNAVKHGRAKKILIRLSSSGLSITDDGSGLLQPASSDGMGLRIMHYRAGMLGGKLSIRNRKSKGVVVNFTFKPLPHHAKTKASGNPVSQKTSTHRR